ncbi:hypothetical protein [Nocardia bovistercoris]|uniref:DUF732 domain-containing protein n=1 Tax=Nocardia bovistercoris TaxID=2785916 RepID=A0A931I7X9_9NOCA|nr:hypothetical protein [Nocardia bovistercoris]MBH0775741.1 hypothetical protein [Nocardia bovistercoris]
MSTLRPRTVTVALIGAAVFGLGATITATPAVAAPYAPAPAWFDGPFTGPNAAQDPQRDQRAQKAEDLGGTVVSEVIDLVTGVVTCGINIATDSVKCRL